MEIVGVNRQSFRSYLIIESTRQSENSFSNILLYNKIMEWLLCLREIYLESLMVKFANISMTISGTISTKTGT